MPWEAIHPIRNGKKKCINCLEEKSTDLFPKQNKCKEGLKPECKVCHNEKQKLYYEKNKDKVLDRTRKYNKTEFRKKYCRDRAKIKLKEKREKNASRPRSEKCEICLKLPTKKGIVWDHDHITNEFRGWICSKCNTLLGMCNDEIAVLKNAIKYLKKYEKQKDNTIMRKSE